MNQSSTKQWRRLGVLCLILVLLFSNTISAAAGTYAYISVNSPINGAFDINVINSFADLGERVTITIEELRPGITLKSLTGIDANGATFTYEASEAVSSQEDNKLVEISEGLYSLSFIANSSVWFTVEESLDQGITLSKLYIKKDPSVYVSGIDDQLVRVEDNKDIYEAIFVTGDVISPNIYSRNTVEIQGYTLNGSDYSTQSFLPLTMNQDHHLEIHAEATHYDISTYIYLDGRNIDNAVELTGPSGIYQRYEIGTPYEISWEAKEGYEIVGGTYRLANPLTFDTVASGSILNNDLTIWDSISDSNPQDSLTLIIDVEPITVPEYFTVTTSASIPDSVDFRVHEAGSFLSADDYIEGTHVEVFWTAEPGYEVVSTTAEFLDESGTVIDTDSYSPGTGGISFDIHNDVRVYCEVQEVPPRTNVIFGTNIGIGASAEGDELYDEGEEVTVTFISDNGFEITSIEKHIYNKNTDVSSFKQLDLSEGLSDTFTAGPQDMNVIYRATVLPIDQNLLNFHVWEEMVTVTDMTKGTTSNNYFGLFDAKETANFTVTADDGYLIAKSYDLSADDVYFVESCDFSIMMDNHYDGFIKVVEMTEAEYTAEVTSTYTDAVTWDVSDTNTETPLDTYTLSDDVTVSWTVAEGYNVSDIQVSYYDEESSLMGTRTLPTDTTELSGPFMDVDVHISLVPETPDVDGISFTTNIEHSYIVFGLEGYAEGDVVSLNIDSLPGYYTRSISLDGVLYEGRSVADPIENIIEFEFTGDHVIHIESAVLPDANYQVTLTSNYPDAIELNVYEPVLDGTAFIAGDPLDQSNLSYLDFILIEATVSAGYELDTSHEFNSTVELCNPAGEPYGYRLPIIDGLDLIGFVSGDINYDLTFTIQDNPVIITGQVDTPEAATITGLGTDFNTFDTVNIDITENEGYVVTKVTVSVTEAGSEAPVVTDYTLDEFNATELATGFEVLAGKTIAIQVTTAVIEDEPDTQPSNPSGGGAPIGGGIPFIPPVAEIIEDEEIAQANPLFIFKPAIKGYEDKTFKPEGLITRAEAAKMFTRVLDVETTEGVSFSDVEALHWALEDIGSMEKAGLIKGYEDKTYKPNNNITKAEFATIISRIMNLAGIEVEEMKTTPYMDINSHWAKDAIEQIYSYGIFLEQDLRTFKPDQKITRAEAVVLINLLMSREINEEDYTIPTYVDVPMSHWAYEHIEAASKE